MSTLAKKYDVGFCDPVNIEEALVARALCESVHLDEVGEEVPSVSGKTVLYASRYDADVVGVLRKVASKVTVLVRDGEATGEDVHSLWDVCELFPEEAEAYPSLAPMVDQKSGGYFHARVAIKFIAHNSLKPITDTAADILQMDYETLEKKGETFWDFESQRIASQCVCGGIEVAVRSGQPAFWVAASPDESEEYAIFASIRGDGLGIGVEYVGNATRLSMCYAPRVTMPPGALDFANEEPFRSHLLIACERLVVFFVPDHVPPPRSEETLEDVLRNLPRESRRRDVSAALARFREDIDRRMDHMQQTTRETESSIALQKVDVKDLEDRVVAITDAVEKFASDEVKASEPYKQMKEVIERIRKRL